MLLLTDALKLASTAVDDMYENDYGVEVQYKNSGQRTFLVTVNDWTGKESHFVLGSTQFRQQRNLLWKLYEAIEQLDWVAV